MRTKRIAVAVALATVWIPSAGCDSFGTPHCDEEIISFFRAVPPVDGVHVDLHGSTGIGCTDDVTVPEPEAFADHYEQAMRDAGWSVLTDGTGVLGKGSSGSVR